MLPALFVWLELLVAAAKMPLEEAALASATLKYLSNLLFLDIYDCNWVYDRRHLNK